jgi:hypothetical protein
MLLALQSATRRDAAHSLTARILRVRIRGHFDMWHNGNVMFGSASTLILLSAIAAALGGGLAAAATAPAEEVLPPKSEETIYRPVDKTSSLRSTNPSRTAKQKTISNARDDAACAACYAGCTALGLVNPHAAAVCAAGCADLCRK